MKVFERFKELILQKRYFDAHEILEQAWIEAKKNNSKYKNAYRGFINAAVALELKKRGKNNYKKVWATYEKYRNLYLQKDEFIELMKFLDSKKP